MRQTLRSVGFATIILWSMAAHAITFPALSGRVVDDAHVLSPNTIQTLDEELAAHEQTTTNQIVVVTLPSLQSVPIEQFGYQLGRAWGIGQKGKNNGVLLIFAPHERKVRIEVGYGLEGTLTDAVSSQIIQTIIIPQLRENHFDAAALQGVDAMRAILDAAAKKSPLKRTHGNYFILGIFGLFGIFFMATIGRAIIGAFIFVILWLVGLVLKLCGAPRLAGHLKDKKKWCFFERVLFFAFLPGAPVFGEWGRRNGLVGHGSGGYSGGGGSFGGGGSSGDY